ncbi:Serine/threonine-protein kinase AfsK [Polystyrenella longa]|uniref:Serine/threonine-protein kinase AfsK n=1 Tax=Polystyrenella longa TaxID=2528007 RepID=A0A518CSL1_9PLAN|nr:PQQ-binding-like beta-propeller repeat protein [Polystyrenella longa]QDU82205.1 Serine/threonine-protein kinase AfsK [Polystyrenella longa]
MLTRTFLTICCLSSLFFVDTASAQMTNHNKSAILPNKALLSRYALERGGWGQAVVDPLGDEVLHIAIDDALMYVQTKMGNITALDLQTGKRLWYYKFGDQIQFMSPMVSDSETAYFISGVHLVALEKFSGNEKWMLRLPGAVTSQILVDEKQIYFGDVTGMFYAVDLERTEDFAKRGELPRSSFDTINWRYRSADEVLFAPVRIEEEILFVSDDGTMYALARSDKKQYLHFEGDSPVVAPLSTRGRQIYMSVADPSLRRDKRIFCLNERNGETLWQRVLTQPVLQRMIVVKDNLFAVPVRKGLMMLHADTGQRFWQNREAVRFLTLTESFVIAEDALDNILLIDRNTGETLGRLPLRDFSLRYQNEMTDRLYVATKSGLVVSIHEEGSDFPVFYRNQEEQPIDPKMAPNASEQKEGGLLEPDSQSEKPAEKPVPEGNDPPSTNSSAKPIAPPADSAAPANTNNNDDGFFNFDSK